MIRNEDTTVSQTEIFALQHKLMMMPIRSKEAPYVVEESCWVYDLLSVFKPKSPLEERLHRIFQESEEIEKRNDLSVDKISIYARLEWSIQSNIDSWHRELKAEIVSAGAALNEGLLNDLVALHLVFIFLTLCEHDIKYLIESGAYVYPNPGRHIEPLPDTDSIYSEIRNWVLDYENTTIEEYRNMAIEDFFPFDVQTHYFSRIELEQINLFRNRGSSERSKAEQKIWKEAYRLHIDGQIKESLDIDNSNFNATLDNPKLLLPERRELVLKGWLVGNGYAIGDVVSQTREQVWNQLKKAHPVLFNYEAMEPKNGEMRLASTPEKFLDKQNSCKFR